MLQLEYEKKNEMNTAYKFKNNFKLMTHKSKRDEGRMLIKGSEVYSDDNIHDQVIFT